MDRITKERRSWNMSRIRGKNTKPEMVVRKYLYANGVRYRLHTNLSGKPDIAIKKIRTVIFINGCFWHGHENCRDSGIPKSNTEFWRTKIESNITRDRKNIQDLESSDWEVITIWECELKKMPEAKLDSLASIIQLRLRNYS